MYLKSLELLGFKTFADKTTLHFPDGITSIVGPNGSGKSNISDALRWVLGEQSLKDLRSASLQEVIFNGSDARKPLGLAQVTLTIDNSDNVLPVEFAEVSITRCVYRSGDSEFLINKTPCRLKDIHDLFLGTGLGRDTYSIVGQGQVDLVLSSKPEDRRLLFEEAAGTSRIKYKKKEALRKLDASSQNLSRVLDILNEVEAHLEPLRKQAEKAKRYVTVKSEYNALDLSYKNLQLKRLGETLLSVDGKILKQNEALLQLKENMQTLESAKSGLNEKLNAIDNAVHETRQRLQECAAKKNHFSEEAAVIRERRNGAEANQKYLHEENSRYDAKDKQCAQEIDESLNKKGLHENLKHEAEQNKILIENELEKLKAKIRREQTVLDERNKELIEILRKLALCHNEQVFYEKLLRDRENEEVSLSKEEKISAEKQKEIAEKREAISAHLHKLSQSERNLLQLAGGLEAVIEEARNGAARLEEKLHQTESRLFAKQSELSIYENFVRHYSHEEIAAEIRQIVPDLGQTLFTGIHVREGYERALEAALGARLETFLVRDAETAKKIILMLKEKNKGRARLAVLDLFQSAPGNGSSAAYPEKEGICGAALNFVAFEDERLSPFMMRLLEHVLVVDDIHCAFLLAAEEILNTFTFATLDGDILSPDGLYEGGSRHHESLLEINRLRQEAESHAVTLAGEKENLDGRLAFANGVLTALNGDLKNMQNELNKARGEKTRVLSEDVSLLEQEKAVQKELEMYGVQLSACREDKQFHENQYRALEEKKHVYENQKSFLESDIKAKEETMARLAEEEQAAAGHLAQKNLEIVKLQEQIMSLLDSIKSLEEQISGIHSEREMCHVKIQECVALFNELSETENKIEAQLAEISAAGQLIEEELVKSAEERKNVVTLISENDARIKGLWEESSAQNEALKQLEIEHTRCGVSLEEIERTLSDEYGMTKDTLTQEGLVPIENEEEAQARLLRLRNSLKNMGSVNTEAEKEYEELKERHVFLSTQKQDIEASVEKLKETLRELDTEARALFLKTFYEIEKHFRDIFTQLFGGGDAKLILLEGEDIFDVGVELRVQLPGKALQPISLLSGGEKSLVAVALLFAILAANPSPFCVLDEIDAALDESNVGRFAELVKAFSDRTQFIVITHNKGTMKAADVLYGVTMEQPGISKLISLKLGEVREEMLARNHNGIFKQA